MRIGEDNAGAGDREGGVVGSCLELVGDEVKRGGCTTTLESPSPAVESLRAKAIQQGILKKKWILHTIGHVSKVNIWWWWWWCLHSVIIL